MISAHPILGIIGGMGPEATVEFMARIVKATSASDDADHLHMIVDSNSRIPSRIKALIEGTGESPEPELIRMARMLEAAGATFLAMPCNTAHGYASQIKAAVRIPMLDMVEKTVDTAAEAGEVIGLLASTAVVKLALYHKAFAERGLRVLVPSEQELLMHVIKAVKRGETGPTTKDSFSRIADGLAAQGAGTLLIACTELSILAVDLNAEARVIDSLDVLRDAVLTHAGMRER